jgi:hypothetical protein
MDYILPVKEAQALSANETEIAYPVELPKINESLENILNDSPPGQDEADELTVQESTVEYVEEESTDLESEMGVVGVVHYVKQVCRERCQDRSRHQN